MHNFSNISILKALDNLPIIPVNSSATLKDVPPPAVSFNNVLQEQLNNANPVQNESNIYNNTESFNTENSNSQKAAEKQEMPVDPGRNSVIKAEDNKNINIDDKKAEVSGNEKEDIQKSDNIDTRVKSKNKSEDEKTEQKDKITKESQENKIKNKSGEISNDISSLLKEIASILDMIKNLNVEKKQIQEIKSVLSEIRAALEPKNSQNQGDKNSVLSENGQELRKLLDKLKSLLDTANQKAGLDSAKNFSSRELKSSENSSEASDIAVLKKQLSKLADEIRQHLNNAKPDNAVSKNDEIVNENKNINNQKIFNEVSSGEKKDGAPTKDNSSNYNFSFSKKDVETAGSVLGKNAVPGTEKRNAFGDELNTIMQNAKIVVRDSKNGSFSIRMQPESLGRVNVNLNLEQGVLVGKFLVDTNEAKEALLENIQSVVDKLQESGISVGGFNVNVRDENKSRYDYNNESVFHNFGMKKVIEAAGAGYESNSSYVHDGAIDMII